MLLTLTPYPHPLHTLTTLLSVCQDVGLFGRPYQVSLIHLFISSFSFLLFPFPFRILRLGCLVILKKFLSLIFSYFPPPSSPSHSFAPSLGQAASLFGHTDVFFITHLSFLPPPSSPFPLLCSLFRSGCQSVWSYWCSLSSSYFHHSVIPFPSSGQDAGLFTARLMNLHLYFHFPSSLSF